MRILLRSEAGERELACVVDDPSATTLADVLVAAGLAPPDVIGVDERRVPTDHTVLEAAVADGAVLRLEPPPTRPLLETTGTRAAARLEVVAGTGAGRTVDLAGPLVVGRDPRCGLRLPSGTVSGEHCRIAVDGRGAVSVVDLGSTNGTWVDGESVGRRPVPVGVGAVIRCGAVALRVVGPAPDDRPRGADPVRNLGAGRAVPFNRPPRPGAPPPVPAVPVPEALPDARERPSFQLASILVPIALGGLLVAVTGSWRYALFVLLGPVMLIATTVSNRRSHARRSRAGQASVAAARADFARALTVTVVAERSRRWRQQPSIAETVRRAQAPSTRLWERRPGHEDWLRLTAGVGAEPWSLPVTSPSHGTADPEAAATAEAIDRLTDSPVLVDLSQGGVVGIVGDRGGAVALARALVLQAATHHGPADLSIAVAIDTRALPEWHWTTWLPHTRGSGPVPARSLAAGESDARALLESLRDGGAAPAGTEVAGTGRTTLVVLDAPGQLRGRDAAARAVLQGAGGPVAGIVLAGTADELPAVCDTVVELRSADGDGVLVRPATRTVVEDLLVSGVDPVLAASVARRLAGLEDPEVRSSGDELPHRTDLLGLLDHDATDARALQGAWADTEPRTSLSVPAGVGPDGPLLLDLAVDGPHGLVGGTTGSGKSELLRTLVAGLAARYAPTSCTFVLIDYKGGAAFDACAELPHVVGLVTDLDEHLGQRALTCLEAELTHRERRLRAAGVADLAAWRGLPPAERGEPLPRLVVVIDEFATLKAELPDFVASLVSIAQRGRSLGVHLVLGTQRPAGSVDENVRANANLRIALRTTDARDSTDVVGVPDAAAISPSQPGRAVLRRGPSDPEVFQSALVTGRHTPHTTGVRVGTVAFGATDDVETGPADAEDGPSDLQRIVAATRAASRAAGIEEPRRPWPAPLPARVVPAEAERIAGGGALAPFALVDEPEQQRMRLAEWDGRSSLLVVGAAGSGTTTTLAAVVLAAARATAPDLLHLHVLDLGRGALGPLVGLPHCGAVVTAREEERRDRLVAWLVAEAARRRGMGAEELAAAPLHVTVVDGLEQLTEALDDPAAYEGYEALVRFLADGAALRMPVLASTSRPGSLRHTVLGAFEHRLLHRLASPDDALTLGLRSRQPADLPPGRAVRVGDGRELQVLWPGDDLGGAVGAVAAQQPPVTRPPVPIGTLPDALPVAHVAGRPTADEDGWLLPVGVDAGSLQAASLPLRVGEHALVLGAAGSGRSSLLAGLRTLALDAGAEVRVVAAGRSPLAAVATAGADGLAAVLEDAAQQHAPVLVLVDDAEDVLDPGPSLERLRTGGEAVVVVAAARPDALTGDYGHWLRRVARSRRGLVLRPDADGAADVFGVRLPRRAPVASGPGRGWLLGEGAPRFVQTIGPA